MAVAALAIAAAASAGCGDQDPGALVTPDCQSAEGDLLPWKTGNTWTYRVTEDTTAGSVVTMKETVIGAMEPVGGTGPHKDVLAYKVVTHKGLMDQTVSWQAPDPAVPERVIRYREQSFSASTGLLELEEHWDPAKLHIDGTAAHRIEGVEWLEMYQETKQEVDKAPMTAAARDVWHVLGACVSVTVPAGTFKAIHLWKFGGSSTKFYWYVPGVGKVKEEGGQTEELVAPPTLVP
jgi:hypothetical protein